MEDKELLEKFRNEDTRNYAYNLLVRKYQEKVYWHIRKMVIDHDDTDDLVQEVFIKIWKNLVNFKEASQLYTWIYRIATNECLTFLNKKRKRFFFSLGDVENELASKIDSSPYVDGDEIQKRLQKALLKLPDKQRLVFNMKYFDEMKYDQIAEITETSIGSLKASYHHAVKKIEEIMSED
ncbi:sigma-70 family RNA polymerase sigma factor [Fulvivirgaceae bacterium BMA10]|uniref:RNA polymerase sigma factor n=1 Tax=Splendidivirga corallicola TaxID=3051826 RepID=A0ABT8KW43_9BACT|nr:sigma-70 family RNA polymerase sigma factor [Fulvivirgaceae bacterium BMA10]